MTAPTDRLDDAARELARPLTRRRALMVAAGALLGVSVAGTVRAPRVAAAFTCADSSTGPACAERGLAFCCEQVTEGFVIIGGCYDPSYQRCCIKITPNPPRAPAAQGWICHTDTVCEGFDVHEQANHKCACTGDRGVCCPGLRSCGDPDPVTGRPKRCCPAGTYCASHTKLACCPDDHYYCEAPKGGCYNPKTHCCEGDGIRLRDPDGGVCTECVRGERICKAGRRTSCCRGGETCCRTSLGGKAVSACCGPEQRCARAVRGSIAPFDSFPCDCKNPKHTVCGSECCRRGLVCAQSIAEPGRRTCCARADLRRRRGKLYCDDDLPPLPRPRTRGRAVTPLGM